MLVKINKLNFNGVDIYVGIDTHKTNWTVAIQIGDLIYQTISQSTDAEQLNSYLRKNFPGGIYHIAYEAGFCGFWIGRYFTDNGIDCIVVNPVYLPTKDKEKR